MWSFPVILFALFALLYLEVDQRLKAKKESSCTDVPKWKRVWLRLRTQPILVKSLLGVLTGVDLLVISFVVFATMWIFVKPLIPMLEEVDRNTMKPGIDRWMIKVGRVGTWTGRAWYLPMALLFIPVSRNSPFLRLVNLPYEHAVRLHRWLGHFSLVILLLHSITFSLHIYYTGGGSVKGIFEWKTYGVSNWAGVLSMLAGIVMWVTSLGPIRQPFFDVFYVTHHMYILVFAFGVWHVGDFSSFYFLAGVLLFFIDRFVRMVQSQSPVSILSARTLSSGVIELKFPRSQELKYNALGFIFINVPEISKFQWHPFSTTSSSLQDNGQITVCIKPAGAWTRNLQKLVKAADAQDFKSGGCPLPFRVFAEGPYGPEQDYFLGYKTLVLVAGGVGITPFLAVLRDLLCHHQAGFGSAAGLPTKVHLIWCVPRRADLATLGDIKPALLFPGFEDGPLTVDVKAYVTREQIGAEPTDNKVPASILQAQGQECPVINNPTGENMTRQNAVSDIRSSNLWYAGVIAAASTGFIVFHGIFHNYVVRPNHHTDAPFYFEHGSAHASSGPQGKPFPTWITVSLLFISMFLGVVVCGGSVLFAWARLGFSRAQAVPKPSVNDADPKVPDPKVTDLERREASLLEVASITAGTRPNLSELLYTVGAGLEGENVGVLVSGPESMNDSVASACRDFNFRNVCGGTQLQYHTISFDL